MAVPTRSKRERGVLAAWIAGGYALVVIGVAVFTLIALRSDDSGLSGIWLIIVTAPASVLVSQFDLQGNAYLAALVAGGLAQAAVLWLAVRGRRTSGRP